MKKLTALLLTLVLLTGVFTAASATESGTSVLMSAMDYTPSQFVSTSYNRALAVVLAEVDAMVDFNFDSDDVNWSGSFYVGAISSIGVDVYIPRKAGGYYNIVWYIDDTIYLYTFYSYNYSKIVAANTSVYYYSVPLSDINKVASDLNEIFN